MKNAKRFLSALLCAVLLLSLMPAAAAEEAAGTVWFQDDCTDLAGSEWVSGTKYAEHSTLSITQAEDGYSFRSTTTEGLLGIRRAGSLAPGAVDVAYTATFHELPVITQNLAWRGFVTELRDVETIGLRRFSFCKDADGNIIFCILTDATAANPNGASETVVTGLSEGDTADVLVRFDDRDNAALYIDGKLIKTFVGLNCAYATSTHVGMEMQAANVNRAAGSKINVTLHNVEVSYPPANSSHLSANNALTAYLAQNITVDGVLEEKGWMLPVSMGSSKLGAMWDSEMLYLGLKTNASQVGLTVGETEVAFDTASSTFSPQITGAMGAAADGTVELAIPFEALGIEVSLTNRLLEAVVRADSHTYEAGIVLIGNLVLMVDDLNRYEGYSDAEYNMFKSENITISHNSTTGVLNFQCIDSPADMAIKGIKKDLGYMGGAFDVEMTLDFHELPVLSTNQYAAWRGFVFELANDMRCRYGFTRDEAGNVLCSVLYADSADKTNGRSVSVDTGVDIGEVAKIRLSRDGGDILRLYVNHELVHTFAKLDFTSTWGRSFMELYINYANAGSYGVNVDLLEIAVTQALEPWQVLDHLTFDKFAGSNPSANLITTDLALPETAELCGFHWPVVWSSSDISVLDHTGKVVSPAMEGSKVVLTACVTIDGVEYAKTFDLTVYETSEIASYFLENDRNPYTGAMISTNVAYTFTLDQNYNSVGTDLGAVQRINYVQLTDDDGLHRSHRDNLSVYVSDDNVTYTKITDYSLARNGKVLYFYGFEAEGRYVKVHSHLDNTAGAGLQEKLHRMISAGYNAELPGNGGGSFRKLGTVGLQASVSGEDLVAKLTAGELGLETLSGGLRLTLQGEMLPYWVDGNAVYVRVPAAEAGQLLVLEVWGGNDSALDLSDMESVFEVTYGNRTIMDMSTEDKSFNHNIAVTRAPNGDLLAIGDDTTGSSRLTMRRSSDGGRTWSDDVEILNNGRMADGGGFLVDQDTVWYFFHHNNGTTLKVAVIRSEDNGYSWSAPVFVPTDHFYHVTYCDGVKTAAYDGEGEGIDYVFAYHFSEDGHNAFNTSVIYSADDGETWISSESVISYGGASAFESGVTEAAIARMSNGDLLLLARCQFDGVDYLAKSVSKDHGLTWQEDAELSSVPSVNTMPAMENYGDDILLLWAGNNNMGGTSYMRYPLTLAWSGDDGETWQQKLDLWCGTSKGNYYNSIKGIQPSMDFTDYAGDGEDLFVAWWENWNSNSGLLIEEAEDYIYKTKGAADTFETASAVYEGWQTIAGGVSIAETEGGHALQLVDAANTVVRAGRSVPMMNAGEISFDVNPQSLATGLFVELKSTYNASHYKSDLIMLNIDASGNIKPYDAHNRTVGAPLGQVSLNQWSNIAIRFDVTKGAAQVYLNGSLLGDLPVNLQSTDGGVCYVQICDGSTSATPGLTCLIDNFVATEGVSLTTVALPEIAGTTMTLGNDLALNFMIEKADVTGEGWYAEIVHGEKTTVMEQAEWETSGDYVRISYNGIAAKEMVDDVTITIYDAEGNELASRTDSARAYAMRMFGYSSAFDTVLADMLNYGAEAQKLLNYKTDDLANKDMSDEQKACASASVTMTDIRETAAGYQGATLELESNILLNFYYSASYVGKTATVSYTDHYGVSHNYDVVVAADGSYGKVSVDKLVISDCSVKVTVTIDGVSVTDSVESYCARMQNELALGEPLMKFAASAREFFGS